MEYVVVIACGVALALLLNQVMAFAEVQGALKDKIMQVITGQNMVVSVDEDSKEQSLDERKNDFFRRPEWINDLASGYQALKNKFKEGLSETWENVKNIELGEVAQSLWNNTTNALDSVWQWMKENKEVVASAGVIIAGVGLLLIPGLEPLGLMLLANWGLSLGFGALLNGGKVDKTVLLGAAIGGAAGAIGGGVASALFSGLAKFAPGLGAAITGSRFLGPIISGGRQILGKAPALVQRMASGLFSKMGAMAATEGAITSGVDDWLRGKELNWKRAILSGLAGATLVGFASGAYPLVQPLINKATATIEKHAGPVVAKINKLPIPTLEVLEAPGVGKVPNSKTVGDTPFGAWLQKFAGKRTDKSSSPKFDFAKVRKEGIKKIENKYGGVVEGESNKSSVLNPRDIRFMQSTISNKTGDYTVFNNANTFSKNPSKIFELEPIRVWKDGKGNIWTLDHRRLGAARLAEIDKIPVRWVSKAEVYKDAWKLTTKVDGKSVILKNGDGTTHIIK
ncbi:hypothetical protein SAMN06265361_10490 [Laceyella tengchongensis]|uniref:Pre-toxin TG domain-containing protein n=1 Tax=Laceyella tengchongensis TaxID=574699 RepID=A0AA45WPP8_9BACL|nr:ParB/Srx family N-terminal domain-containing protein [Laceyella tengchongensis]SMP22674.1 hypothetical protein SAMN06265361_10490 [Laceyella tengchongensis]